MSELRGTEAAGEPATAEQGGPLGRRQLLLVFSGMMLAVLLASLDQTIVAAALPTIVGELHGLEQMSWVVTAYLLSSTISLTLYGKLGDLFGRKPVFLFAIVVFLLGSALTGLSQNMGQLIAFRALQGIGGGGLMISMQAIIGDLISPRERGRYMGMFGAVFAVSSVAGPLIGGFLTDQWSWRWCFYINLPLGLLTLAVVVAFLKLPRPTGARPKLDYLGAFLMAVAVTGLVLVTNWGGTEYAWGSPTIIGLVAVTLVFGAAFLLVERRAAEPIMPLHLFRSRVFNFANGIGFVVGVAMFGTIVYIPSYFQMVLGDSATAAGLRTLPLMAGLLVASVASGQLISATGRYRVFPILGTATAALGLVLLSRLDTDTPYLEASLYMLVLGLGIGMVMQVLILVVQNAAQPRDLGTATSTTNFLRQVGGSVGAAVVGALFTSRLTDQLTAALPPGAQLPTGSVSSITPALVQQFPPQIHDLFVNAYVEALTPVFLYLSPLFLVAFVLAWLLPQLPLRSGGRGGRGSVSEEEDATAVAEPAQAPI